MTTAYTALLTEKCTECHYSLSVHFERDGSSIGCPIRLSNADALFSYPRIMIRIGKGTRRDHVLVVWADIRDGDTDALLMWDRDTGEQFWVPMCTNLSKRAPLHVQERVKDDIEYEVGGKVRVVQTAHRRVAAAG